jgi:putative ABC transport system permease protein
MLGIVVAWWGLRALMSWVPRAVPRGDELALDLRVLFFAAAVSILTGVMLGIPPAMRAARASLTDLLREGGLRGTGSKRRELSRRLLIVAEVTLSLILLVGAGLSLRSLARLRSVDPGFETERILAAHVDLTGPRYDGNSLAEDNSLKIAYFDELLERVRAIPGVTDAGVTSTIPLTPAGIDFDLPYRADGMPLVPEQQAPQVDYRIISPGYVGAMGIRLLQGREFEAADRADSRPVLLVNETFARKHWPGSNPIGKSVFIFYINNRPWEVVGVVSDTRHAGLSVEPEAQMFVPMAQAELLFGYMTLVVRTAGEVPGLLDRVQDAAVAIDASEPLFDFDTVETLVADATARDRLAALVFGAFAVLAIVLSAAGIYGVVSYQMARRTREIGVRIALGASRRRVLGQVVGEAATLALIGIGLGLGLAALGTRIVASFLYGISAHDPLTFIGVSALLLAIAVTAALIPALRAASIHPVQALRSE